MRTAKELISYMESMRDEGQKKNLMRFFKTGKGEYGEGDEFLGIKVPQTRVVVKMSSGTPLDEIPELLTNRFHEIRLCGFLLLADNFAKFAKKNKFGDRESAVVRDEIAEMYRQYADYANNWDLVDLSAPNILGRWLLLPTGLGDKRDYVDGFAASDSLWRKRISMVCTWMTSRSGDPSWCLRYAKIHLHHPHDLMHKAVGWMLREMGKQNEMDLLRDFIRENVATMPRTTLRYAIEKMDPEERKYWMTFGR